jgi:hypothetical protein
MSGAAKVQKWRVSRRVCRVVAVLLAMAVHAVPGPARPCNVLSGDVVAIPACVEHKPCLAGPTCASIPSQIRTTITYAPNPAFIQYAPGAAGYEEVAAACGAHEGSDSLAPVGRLFYLALPPFVYPQASAANGCSMAHVPPRLLPCLLFSLAREPAAPKASHVPSHQQRCSPQGTRTFALCPPRCISLVWS